MNAVRRLSAVTFVFAFWFAWASSSSAQKLKDSDCLTCHADAGMTDSDGHSIAVDQTKFKHSVHGTFSWPSTATLTSKALAHEAPPKKVTCDQCHADEGQGYAHSIHAQVAAAGKIPASCQDCHGDVHQIVSGDDPKSSVNRTNIPTTCGRCHGKSF